MDAMISDRVLFGIQNIIKSKRKRAARDVLYRKVNYVTGAKKRPSRDLNPGPSD